MPSLPDPGHGFAGGGVVDLDALARRRVPLPGDVALQDPHGDLLGARPDIGFGAPPAVLGRSEGGLSTFTDRSAGKYLAQWRVAEPPSAWWSEYFDFCGPPEGLEKWLRLNST